MSTPFLASVAQAYADNERDALADYCFVFPNKRSIKFFARELANRAKGSKPLVMPCMKTITELTADWSPWAEASRLDQLFLMHRLYCKRCPEEERPDFDSFLFWGEILLTDFNDVDRYLVDPDRLFTNLKRLREINANYLTDQQRKIIERYWGADRLPQGDATHEFWTHMDSGSKLKKKFLSLWETLTPLFGDFQRALREKSLATQGMMLRHAVDLLEGDDALATVGRHKRYIFVGFNVLTLAEARIFELLQQMKLADFYWDMDSPAMAMPNSRASRFVRSGRKCFKSLYEQVYAEKVDKWPQIAMEGVPSQVGMAKRAGQLLGQWFDEKRKADKSNSDELSDPSKTAVVLADQGLFIPVVHSVPEKIADINVTMGYPLRLTPISAFLDLHMAMHSRMVERKGGQMAVYDDVTALLSHPVTCSLYPESSRKLMAFVRRQKKFSIPLEELRLQAGELEFLFQYFDADKADELFRHLDMVVATLTQAAQSRGGQKMRADVLFMHSMTQALRTLHDAVSRWHVPLRRETFCRLLSRALAGESVPFEGEPLKGLQIMGMLETRGLDFDNIIILSMNENVFPRRIVDQSFIPDTLRRGYGMATSDFQECIFSYYFYRLISRARRVVLLYDNRAQGLSTGEPSRYITQLRYLYPESGAALRQLTYSPTQCGSREISVAKTEEIMKVIDRFKDGAADPLRLSASSIKTYLGCPLRFYLNRVAGFREPESVVDYIDYNVYGTVVHAVCELLYQGGEKHSADAKPVEVTRQMLQDWIDHPETWREYIDRELAENSTMPTDDGKPLMETSMMADVIAGQVLTMLKAELELAPFTFLHGEYQLDYPITLKPSPETGREPVTINVKQIVDRIDRIRDADGHPLLRIVDYKTGSDEIKSTFKDIFSNNLAIMQVLLYCHAYSQQTGWTEAIKPVLYKTKVKECAQSVEGIQIDGIAIEDYHQKPEFMTLLANKVTEIFDPAVAFTQTDDPKHCQYCPFLDICGREVPKH